jgi:gliding motility-associated lipoprotein GldH
MLGVILGVWVLLIAACSSRTVYEQHYPINDTGWRYTDSLEFAPAIADTQQRYDVLLDIAHRPSYGFQNLYLYVRTVFPDGTVREQPLGLDLAERSGRWLGRGSDPIRYRVAIQQNAYFNQLGVYRFVLRQHVRDSVLMGITGVGMAIERSDEHRPNISEKK